MHAPSWLCKELVRRFPDARLAWAGRPAAEDELNAGAFALVQLYPISVVGSLTEPDIFEELWDVTTQANDYGRVVRCRSYRGPIFNKKGGTRPDWDPLFYVPVYKFDFDEQGVNIQKFFAGSWLDKLTRDSIKPVRAAAQERKGKELVSKSEELGRQAFDYLKTMKEEDSSRPQVTAYKHAKEELQKFYKKKEQRKQALLDFYKTKR